MGSRSSKLMFKELKATGRNSFTFVKRKVYWRRSEKRRKEKRKRKDTSWSQNGSPQKRSTGTIRPSGHHLLHLLTADLGCPAGLQSCSTHAPHRDWHLRDWQVRPNCPAVSSLTRPVTLTPAPAFSQPGSPLHSCLMQNLRTLQVWLLLTRPTPLKRHFLATV